MILLHPTLHLAMAIAMAGKIAKDLQCFALCSASLTVPAQGADYATFNGLMRSTFAPIACSASQSSTAR